MASYYWDLGFDFNAVQVTVPGTNNMVSFLQNGFVSMESTGHEPAAPVNLNTGDTFAFNAFNVTSAGGAMPDGTQMISGTITFQNADGNQPVASPFNDQRITANDNGTATMTIDSGSIGTTQQTSPSIIFSGGTNPQVEFPVWNIVPPAAPLVAATNGRFLMTVSLNVQSPGGAPQNFVVDPEMIFGSAG